ncbi:period circadian protein homolog 3-like [Meles meles]|uniref:period circadian protein homolog 3-like n=1 Tax=Meles meles TaxID=9662 RepID=UPI001E698CEA|nr:period circadian protein homolog 3-like [Meles meles]
MISWKQRALLERRPHYLQSLHTWSHCPLSPAGGGRREKWEMPCGEHPCVNSRSSSTLQLNLLQADMLGSCESSDQTRRDICLEAKYRISGSHGKNSGFAAGELSTALLHQEAPSRTGSAASGSRDSSVDFASTDHPETTSNGQQSGDAQEEETFPGLAEEAMWRMIKQTPERVLMTYQVPER